MFMPDIDTVRGWQGRTMGDGDGDRIGSIEADQHLSEAEEQQLWRHYGLDYGAGQAARRPNPSQTPRRSIGPPAQVPADARPATTRPAEASMRR
jgi:hypothetical protein